MQVRWMCHICGRERSDEHISVYTSDLSSQFNLPEGTMKQNVRYCNDRDSCIEGAKKINFFKQGN